MKKFIYFCLFLSLVLFSLPGCEKNDLPVPPVTSADSAFFVMNAVPTTVSYLGTTQISFSYSSDLKSITINGQDLGIKKNITTSSLSKDTIIVSEAIFNDGRIKTQTINVTVENPPLPILTLNIPDSVDNDTPAVLDWTTKNCVSLNINGISYPLTGSLTTEKLIREANFNFVLKGIKDSIVVQKKVFVRPQTLPTLTDYLSKGGEWRKVKWTVSYPLGSQNTYEVNPESCSYDDRMSFTTSPNIMTNDVGENNCGIVPRIWTYKWTLDGNKINGFGGREILELNWEIMIWQFWSVDTDKKPVLFTVYYEH